MSWATMPCSAFPSIHHADKLNAMKNIKQYTNKGLIIYTKRFKQINAANINHLPDTVSYNTLFLDMPALDDGIPGHGVCTMMQIFMQSQAN